jgi:hypothetical protein
MGTSCSRLDKEHDPEHRHEKKFGPSSSEHPRKLLSHRRRGNMDNSEVKAALVVGHYDRQVTTKLDHLGPRQPLVYEKQETDAQNLDEGAPTPQHLEPEYFGDRAEIIRRGQQLAFDHTLTETASATERKAKELLEMVRRNDDVAFYSVAEPLQGYRGQKHRRFAGDHFLTNVNLLDQTALFKVATQMPKGAHLHIHFNSTLLPHVLLDIAQGMEQMYISSDKPLTSADNLDTCEIQFLMKSEDVVTEDRAKLRDLARLQGLSHSSSDLYNLFSSEYTQVVDERNQRLSWMKYRVFREHWDQLLDKKQALPQRPSRGSYTSLLAVESLDKAAGGMTWKNWLISKLVFDDQEAHNSLQTSEG